MNRVEIAAVSAIAVCSVFVTGCQTTRESDTPAPVEKKATVKRSADPRKIDFHRRYKESVAMGLFTRQREYDKAQQAFQELSDTAADTAGKALWLSRTAIAMGYQEGKYDAALKLAKAVSDSQRSAYAQMVILSEARKFDLIIEGFKDEDIAAWPEDIAYEGFRMRGAAYYSAGNIEAAIADYEACVARVAPAERVWPTTMNAIAGLYSKLDQPDRALETYRKAFAVYDAGLNWAGGSYHGQTICGAAAVLISMGKTDEALELLNQHTINSSSIGYRLPDMAGDIYAEQGRKEEALAKYREAAAVPGTRESVVKQLNKKIDDLKNAPKE